MHKRNQSEPRAPSSLGEEILEQTLARWARQEEEARATAATKLAEILDRIHHDFLSRKWSGDERRVNAWFDSFQGMAVPFLEKSHSH